MSRRAALFTEADLKRAIRAAVAAGVVISGIEIDRDGKITIRPTRQDEPKFDKAREIRI
jgi:hypothetical protein